MNTAKFASLLLVILGAAVLGQTRGVEMDQEPDYVYKADGIVKTLYESIENKTHVSVFIPIAIETGSGINRFEVSVGFSHLGQEPAIPENVHFVIHLPCKFAESLLTVPKICFDEECFPLTPMDICEGGLRRERVSCTLKIPAQTFSRIANAHRIEVHLDNTTTILAEKHIEALQKLARRAIP